MTKKMGQRNLRIKKPGKSRLCPVTKPVSTYKKHGRKSQRP